MGETKLEQGMIMKWSKIRTHGVDTKWVKQNAEETDGRRERY
jgi:hypothetical protein